jgi:hypothetical protein
LNFCLGMRSFHNKRQVIVQCGRKYQIEVLTKLLVKMKVKFSSRRSIMLWIIINIYLHSITELSVGFVSLVSHFITGRLLL